nr:hypothetical protein [Tanacetum cinerariifolium]
MSMDDLYNNLKVYEPEVKGVSSLSSSTQNIAYMSFTNNNTSSTNGAVITAHGVSTASTQVNAAYSTNIDNLSDAVICSFFASQPNIPQLVHEDLDQIHPDDMEEMDLRWQMAMLTMRARKFLKKKRWKLTVNGNETIYFDKSNVECLTATRADILLESVKLQEIKTTSTRKAQKGAEEGPNYVIMAFASLSSDSNVSNDSTCLKSCLETVKILKSKNDQLLKDLKKSKLMVLGEIVIIELRKKLEITQKEKYGIQLNVDKFEHAFKSINKLIECQIVDNNKKGLGYENYYAIPPPYTGNFMPPTPDLSFTGLDEFVNKHVVENCKAKSSEKEPKGNPPIDLQDHKVIDSGCSRHMRGNMSYLTDYKEIDGGYLYGKEIVITESSIKRVLQLADEEGIDCLPNSTIFEQLVLMGNWVKVQQFPLIPNTHTIIQSSSSQPQKIQKPRKPKRKDTRVPQPSGPTDNVVDEAVYKELGDNLVRATTIASNLEAEQDNGNITKTQSKAIPNEPSSQGTDLGGGPRGNTLRSNKDSMKLNELMALCTNLQNKVLDLKKKKTTQFNEIASLKRMVMKLEKRNRPRTHKLKRLYKVGLSARVESADNKESLSEDASKQGKKIDDINSDKDITLVNDADKEMFDVDDLGGEETFVAGQNENVVE